MTRTLLTALASLALFATTGCLQKDPPLVPPYGTLLSPTPSLEDQCLFVNSQGEVYELDTCHEDRQDAVSVRSGLLNEEEAK